MNTAVTQEIQEIVKHIKLTTPTSTIILFGSQVNGSYTSESDIDICVITKDTEKRTIQILRDIRTAIAPFSTIPVDILVYREQEFAERSTMPASFEFKLVKEGRKLHG